MSERYSLMMSQVIVVVVVVFGVFFCRGGMGKFFCFCLFTSCCGRVVKLLLLLWPLIYLLLVGC